MESHEHEFEKSSFLLFCITMLANVSNYLFQIIAGKLLNLEDFGVLNSLLSLYTIIAVLAIAVIAVSARYTASFHATGQDERIGNMLQRMTTFVLLLVVGVFGVGTLLAKPIGLILKIDSLPLLIVTMVASALALLPSPFTGALQGLKRFLPYSLTNLITMLCKLILGCLLILVGWHVYGPLVALCIGSVATTAFAVFSLRSFFTQSKPNLKGLKFTQLPRSTVHYAVGTVFVQAGITIISYCDMLIVKAFFSDAQAGEYATAMVIGKMSIYVATAIVGVLYPLVAEQAALKKDSRGTLLKAFLFGGGAAVACALGLVLLGRQIVSILFAKSVDAVIPLLLPISAFVVPLTFLTILTNYLLAIGKTRFLSFSLFGCCAAALLFTWVFHQSIAQTMYILAAVITVTFIVNLLPVLSYKPSAA